MLTFLAKVYHEKLTEAGEPGGERLREMERDAWLQDTRIQIDTPAHTHRDITHTHNIHTHIIKYMYIYIYLYLQTCNHNL